MTFQPYIRRKELEGLSFDFWIGDEAAREWYDLQSFDGSWPEMRFLRDYLVRPGDVVFECGAHHGCTTIALARWAGEAGRVIAFEPLPHNAAVLRRNLTLNAVHNVVVEEKAVGAGAGRVALREHSNSYVLPAGEPQVEMVALDDYAHLCPDLLKIDVEGFECEVLKGARAVLAARPRLAIELHPRMAAYGASVAELLSLLPTDAYELRVQWSDDTEPQPYDQSRPITERVHLFGLPRGRGGRAG
jgi:FkbM family methyltransferase